jgi:hypothetical protein
MFTKHPVEGRRWRMEGLFEEGGRRENLRQMFAKSDEISYLCTP